MTRVTARQVRPEPSAGRGARPCANPPHPVASPPPCCAGAARRFSAGKVEQPKQPEAPDPVPTKAGHVEDLLGLGEARGPAWPGPPPQGKRPGSSVQPPAPGGAPRHHLHAGRQLEIPAGQAPCAAVTRCSPVPCAQGTKRPGRSLQRWLPPRRQQQRAPAPSPLLKPSPEPRQGRHQTAAEAVHPLPARPEAAQLQQAQQQQRQQQLRTKLGAGPAPAGGARAAAAAASWWMATSTPKSGVSSTSMPCPCCEEM
jgi:hypothetical protein